MIPDDTYPPIISVAEGIAPDDVLTMTSFPSHIKVKCENLEIDVNEAGYGSILLDGHPFNLTGLELKLEAGRRAELTMRTLPILMKLKP